MKNRPGKLAVFATVIAILHAVFFLVTTLGFTFDIFDIYYIGAVYLAYFPSAILGPYFGFLISILSIIGFVRSPSNVFKLTLAVSLFYAIGLIFCGIHFFSLGEQYIES